MAMSRKLLHEQVMMYAGVCVEGAFTAIRPQNIHGKEMECLAFLCFFCVSAGQCHIKFKTTSILVLLFSCICCEIAFKVKSLSGR